MKKLEGFKRFPSSRKRCESKYPISLYRSYCCFYFDYFIEKWMFRNSCCNWVGRTNSCYRFWYSTVVQQNWAHEWERYESTSFIESFTRSEMCQYGFLWKLHVWKIKESEFYEEWEGKQKWEIRDYAYRCMGISSLGGSHYYVTFINDVTRKVWIYFLINLMYFKLLRNGNVWLKMRLERI